MNFLLAAMLFFLTWWFAEQGLYFFSMLFIIVLVITALASGNRAPSGPLVNPPAPHEPHPGWDDTQIEKFGRNLATIVMIPLKIIWEALKFLFGTSKK